MPPGAPGAAGPAASSGRWPISSTPLCISTPVHSVPIPLSFPLPLPVSVSAAISAWWRAGRRKSLWGASSPAGLLVLTGRCASCPWGVGWRPSSHPLIPLALPLPGRRALDVPVRRPFSPSPSALVAGTTAISGGHSGGVAVARSPSAPLRRRRGATFVHICRRVPLLPSVPFGRGETFPGPIPLTPPVPVPGLVVHPRPPGPIPPVAGSCTTRRRGGGGAVSGALCGAVALLATPVPLLLLLLSSLGRRRRR